MIYSCLHFDCYVPAVWYWPHLHTFFRNLWLDKPQRSVRISSGHSSSPVQDMLILLVLGQLIPVTGWTNFFVTGCFASWAMKSSVEVERHQCFKSATDQAAELTVVWVRWHVPSGNPHACPIHGIRMWSREYEFCYLSSPSICSFPQLQAMDKGTATTALLFIFLCISWVRRKSDSCF